MGGGGFTNWGDWNFSICNKPEIVGESFKNGQKVQN